MAFMAMMNFEAEMIMAEKQLGKTQPGVEAIINDVGALAVESMIPLPGGEVTEELVGATAVSFAEMPGVHNLFASMEPYWDDFNYETRFRWVTDIASLSRRPFTGPTPPGPGVNPRDPMLEVKTTWLNGVPPHAAGLPDFVPVDADGDGIVDSVQVELVDKTPIDPDTSKEKTGRFVIIERAQLENLRKAVNPASNPAGKVFLGLRIVTHGGMVDLNHSDESLIRTTLSYPTDKLRQTDADFEPYDPALEEPSLRRRNLLPPRLLPPSRIQGNPLADPSGDLLLYPLEMYGGHFADKLFPRDSTPRETPREHRYQPFAPDERDNTGLELLWKRRMDPDDPDGGEYYDWRHLVTTISHDDLLRRETWVEWSQEREPPAVGMELKRADVLDLMTEANIRHLSSYYSGWDDLLRELGSRTAQACWTRRSDPDMLPFETAAYPHGDDWRDTYHRAVDVDVDGTEIIEGVAAGMLADWCKCQGDPTCTLNPVKGKLRLSLPWLDVAVEKDAAGDSLITPEQQIRLIQDAFTMMLLNARGSEWGEWQNVDLNGDRDYNNDAYDVDLDGITDPGEGVPRVWNHNFAKISLTAASLTANLIDFADTNDGDAPTRVELRSADFRPLRDNTGGRIFWPNGDPITIFGMDTCGTEIQAVGDHTVSSGINPDPSLPACGYVYGLERQPFITEVAADVVDDATGVPDPAQSAFAVELFNPYEDGIDLSKYYLRVNESGAPIRFVDDLPANKSLAAREFIALEFDPIGDKFPEASVVPLSGAAGADGTLGFVPGDRVYLIREHQSPDGGSAVQIVVDQFDITGNLAQVTHPEQPQTIERIGVWKEPAYAASPWLAPIPAPGNSRNGHSLGEEYPSTEEYDPKLAPVEVLFANTGSLGTAFPTTGSLLLLMRHANSTSKAFTAYLDDTANVWYYDENSDAPDQHQVLSSYQIDNGRMPVFDVDYVHHLEPAIKDPGAPYDASLGGPDIRLTRPDPYEPGEPGGLRNVPWGQLVFDYFTALPLSNDGPYTDDGDWDIPRVDEGGLRVHGRININAAPWPVLAGLPFASLRDVPATFRQKFDDVLGLPGNPANLDDPSDPPFPGPIGEELAKAIVAYRDGRGITDRSTGAPLTGNYGDTEYDNNGEVPGWRGWRGWTEEKPKARRGTGFISVGELANIRHDSDGFPPGSTVDALFRFDSAKIPMGPTDSYIQAVAALAALGDWVTVRSHVFTIYGVLRGDEDETLEYEGLQGEPLARLRAADVSSRAIRFQETVDRLPMFLGETVPKRIGKRTVAKYDDFRGD
jgi:hypothetical protein